MTEQRVDTSRQAHVVLDIGGDVGALVIHTDASLDGVEIEVSPVEVGTARVHSDVHPRWLGPGAVVYAAVLPSLRAGRYTVWRNASEPWGEITISGGAVTEIRWE